MLASVNREVSDLVTARIEGAAVTVFQIGKDVPVPIERALDENTKPGDDRLLVALAAYEGLQQACVVVDAGTAVTVDFVDGEGTFQGGAIAPGLRMMLGALHEGTDALPALELVGKLPKEPFGKRTGDAMQLGCIASVQGLVRHLAERYAVAYDAYPLIVATGGDAELLFGNDELIDRIVPDLALRGIAIACQKALASQADNG
ncbi:MAG: type III pantothenate kinase [Planctomycetota bacterium]